MVSDSRGCCKLCKCIFPYTSLICGTLGMLCKNIFGAGHGILPELSNAENVVACKIYIIDSMLAIEVACKLFKLFVELLCHIICPSQCLKRCQKLWVFFQYCKWFCFPFAMEGTGTVTSYKKCTSLNDNFKLKLQQNFLNIYYIKNILLYKNSKNLAAAFLLMLCTICFACVSMFAFSERQILYVSFV